MDTNQSDLINTSAFQCPEHEPGDQREGGKHLDVVSIATVMLKSTWPRGGGAARISQYLCHGEIRTSTCQDAVSTATVVLKQASLPEGYGGLSHLQSPRKINTSGRLLRSQEKLKNPDSYVGFSSTSPLTQYVKSKPNVVCSTHAGESQVQTSQSQSVICAQYMLLTIPMEPEEMTDPGASISLRKLHLTKGSSCHPLSSSHHEGS